MDDIGCEIIIPAGNENLLAFYPEDLRIFGRISPGQYVPLHLNPHWAQSDT